MEVTLENGESHRLVLGSYDFNGNNIYAQIFSSEDLENSGADESESGETEAEENNEGSHRSGLVATSQPVQQLMASHRDKKLTLGIASPLEEVDAAGRLLTCYTEAAAGPKSR